MPRIPDTYLNSVFYLYAAAADAAAGERNGGTGFFVSVVDDLERPSFLYAVSNWHVVGPLPLGNARAARVNTKGGGFEVLDGLDWAQHPDGDDIAIARVGLVPENFEYGAVRHTLCLTGWSPGDVSEESGSARIFGPGNEVFFIGRYADHEGRDRNFPVVRFGNIAMMPWERIRNPDLGIDQESYVVESRSLGGFSGSPVFVFPQEFIHEDGQWDFHMGLTTWLLGIVWGHGDLFQKVLDSERKTQVVPTQWVTQNSGLMYVVPSWKLLDLLMDDQEVAMRAELMMDREQENKRKSHGVSVDALDESDGRGLSPSGEAC